VGAQRMIVKSKDQHFGRLTIHSVGARDKIHYHSEIMNLVKVSNSKTTSITFTFLLF